MSAPPPSLFDGPSLDPALDNDRLSKQLGRVYTALVGIGYPAHWRPWWTLRELQEYCGGSEAGISARIRDLRKQKFGAHRIERRRRGDPKAGLWEYRMIQ